MDCSPLPTGPLSFRTRAGRRSKRLHQPGSYQGDGQRAARGRSLRADAHAPNPYGPSGRGSVPSDEPPRQVGLVALGYDALGRIPGEQQIVGEHQLTFETTYDGLGQLALKIYLTTSPHTLVWSRDAAGYLTSIGTQGGAAYASSIEWDASGHLTDWTAGNGAVTTQRYGAVTSRPSETEVVHSGTLHEWLGYGYDAGDLVRTIGDLRPGGLANRSFTYGALDRLTDATGPSLPGFASATLNYGFDVAGNLIALGTRAYAYDVANHLLEVRRRAT